jgi:hypothetical protein
LIGRLSILAPAALLTAMASSGHLHDKDRNRVNDEFQMVGTDADGVRWSVRIADLQAAAAISAVDDLTTPRRVLLQGEVRGDGSQPPRTVQKAVTINCAQRTYSIEADGPAGGTENVRRAARPPAGAASQAVRHPIVAKVMALVCP